MQFKENAQKEGEQNEVMWGINDTPKYSKFFDPVDRQYLFRSGNQSNDPT